MTKQKIYDFKNDVLFTYTLGNDQDLDSYYLLKLLIENLCFVQCQSIIIRNPDLNKQIVEDKNMILDIRVHDNKNRIYNIEMQNSHISDVHAMRFQLHDGSILANQGEAGEDYQEVRHVYQIIFIDDIDSDNPCLVDSYLYRNVMGKVAKKALITLVYVYMSYINDIKEKIGLENFNELLMIIYIFNDGVENDIMEMDEKVVEIMKEKLESFNNSKELRELAFKRTLIQQERNSGIRDLE